MILRLCIALAVLARATNAQSFNVDISDLAGVPSSAYGAGAGQPGTWNAMTPSTGTTIFLAHLDGSPSNVWFEGPTPLFFFPFTIDDPGTFGDDAALLDDAENLMTPGSTIDWTFHDLLPGTYVLYTYAFPPDNPAYVTEVTGGNIDPLQYVTGAWTGAHVQGVTYARHRYVIGAAGSIRVTTITAPGGTPFFPTNYGTVNGFQLVYVPDSVVTPFCSGDGSGTACPCGNNGATGNGCANSVDSNGGHLAAIGVASIAIDTLELVGTGMPNSTTLYFQGTAQVAGGAGANFGDGLRCAGGAIVRLGTRTNTGGGSRFPSGGGPEIHVTGADNAGDVRTYQAWYRNAAAFCTNATYNLTNGVSVSWTP